MTRLQDCDVMLFPRFLPSAMSRSTSEHCNYVCIPVRKNVLSMAAQPRRCCTELAKTERRHARAQRREVAHSDRGLIPPDVVVRGPDRVFRD